MKRGCLDDDEEPGSFRAVSMLSPSLPLGSAKKKLIRSSTQSSEGSTVTRSERCSASKITISDDDDVEGTSLIRPDMSSRVFTRAPAASIARRTEAKRLDRRKKKRKKIAEFPDLSMDDLLKLEADLRLEDMSSMDIGVAALELISDWMDLRLIPEDFRVEFPDK